MEQPLRAGIVGCGFFGQIQLEAWRRMPDVEIVAACDPELERARKATRAAYASAEEMLKNEQLDFLDIATRPDSHLHLVRLAAEHKLPAICQKPMAPSWNDAIAMVDIAERAGVRLMIHENWRWQPWYREVHRRLERGDIGKPISYLFRLRQRDGFGPSPYPRQPYFARMPRLLIYETLVHQIDTGRFLFGDIETVYAQVRRVNALIDGEDQAALILTHVSGTPGVIEAHRFADPIPQGPAMGDMWIDGEEGTLLVNAIGEIFARDRRIWSPPEVIGYKGDSVLATQRHFVQCLRRGEPFESEARQYLRTFEVVEAAYESVAQRVMVRLRHRGPAAVEGSLR
jgi:predicted dehydrogenase